MYCHKVVVWLENDVHVMIWDCDKTELSKEEFHPFKCTYATLKAWPSILSFVPLQLPNRCQNYISQELFPPKHSVWEGSWEEKHQNCFSD